MLCIRLSIIVFKIEIKSIYNIKIQILNIKRTQFPLIRFHILFFITVRFEKNI